MYLARRNVDYKYLHWQNIIIVTDRPLKTYIYHKFHCEIYRRLSFKYLYYSQE